MKYKIHLIAVEGERRVGEYQLGPWTDSGDDAVPNLIDWLDDAIAKDEQGEAQIPKHLYDAASDPQAGGDRPHRIGNLANVRKITATFEAVDGVGWGKRVIAAPPTEEGT